MEYTILELGEVGSLLVNHKDKIIQLLARGQSIQGLQWTTAAAAVRVEALVGQTLSSIRRPDNMPAGSKFRFPVWSTPRRPASTRRTPIPFFAP